MGRPSRDEEPGAIHHVIPRGNGNGRIVEDDRDRHAYSKRFVRVGHDLGWLVTASCLLDTHHHAIVGTPEPNLGEGLRRILGGHSRWLNLRHQRQGSVFRSHCWSKRIEDDGWLFCAAVYVVLNPVVAGLCSHPRDWPWCSYDETANGDPETYAPAELRFLPLFGDTPREARRCYAKIVDEAVELVLSRRLVERRDVWRGVSEPRPSLQVSD